MKKYEVTDIEHPFYEGAYRIRALQDNMVIGSKKGDLGGYVESEDNLSQYGDSWIFDDAVVKGGSMVFRDAWVSGNSVVRGGSLITDNAAVGGDAVLDERCEVSGRSRVRGAVNMFSSKVSEGTVVRSMGNVVLTIRDTDFSDWASVACSGTIRNSKIKRAYLHGRLNMENANIEHSSHVFQMSPVGSEGVDLTLYRGDTGPLLVVGCWSGSLSELMPEVRRRRRNWPERVPAEKVYKEYKIINSLLKAKASDW